MKETPIIMSGNHPKLILDGTKTMTRRVIIDPRKRQRFHLPSQGYGHGIPSVGDLQRELELTKNTPPNFPCPYGQVGDRLWVRETWATDLMWNRNKPSTIPHNEHIEYKATYEYPHHYKWRSSRFMPRWASRITLEITEVRVEKLNSMTESDAHLEGVDSLVTFILLWDRLNKKRGYEWKSNCWVWVLTFKLCQ